MRFSDPGNALELFAHNVERIDSLGSTSRIVFCVPKLQNGGGTVNEVTLTLIVPTDQLAGIAAKLVRAPSASIANSLDDVSAEEVMH